MIDELKSDSELTTLLREMQAIKKELADLKYHVEVRVPVKLSDLLNRLQLMLLLVMLILAFKD